MDKEYIIGEDIKCILYLNVTALYTISLYVSSVSYAEYDCYILEMRDMLMCTSGLLVTHMPREVGHTSVGRYHNPCDSIPTLLSGHILR